jgi:hypothetical protein
MKVVRLIKIYLNETYSRVCVGKSLSNLFPIRNVLKLGDILSLLLFKFDLEYAITRFQGNQEGLKLNGTHQLLVYADDVNVLGGRVHTIKKNPEVLRVAINDIGLDVKVDKTKYAYMVMSRDKNAAQN